MGRVSSGTPSLAYPIGWRGIVIMMVGLGVCLCCHSGHILSASLEKSSRASPFNLDSGVMYKMLNAVPGVPSLHSQAEEPPPYPIPVCKLTIDELHIVWYSMAA